MLCKTCVRATQHKKLNEKLKCSECGSLNKIIK